MTLEYTKHDDGSETVKLVACPKCGKEFDGSTTIRHHLLLDHTAAEWFGDADEVVGE